MCGILIVQLPLTSITKDGLISTARDVRNSAFSITTRVVRKIDAYTFVSLCLFLSCMHISEVTLKDRKYESLLCEEIVDASVMLRRRCTHPGVYSLRDT
jgi:hypothetical protein